LKQSSDKTTDPAVWRSAYSLGTAAERTLPATAGVLPESAELWPFRLKCPAPYLTFLNMSRVFTALWVAWMVTVGSVAPAFAFFPAVSHGEDANQSMAVASVADVAVSSVPAITASCSTQALKPAYASELEGKLIVCPSPANMHNGTSALSCQADCGPCLTAGGIGMEPQLRYHTIASRAAPLQGLSLSLSKKPPRNLL
jgi:hypothetical protein